MAIESEQEAERTRYWLQRFKDLRDGKGLDGIAEWAKKTFYDAAVSKIEELEADLAQWETRGDEPGISNGRGQGDALRGGKERGGEDHP